MNISFLHPRLLLLASSFYSSESFYCFEYSNFSSLLLKTLILENEYLLHDAELEREASYVFEVSRLVYNYFVIFLLHFLYLKYYYFELEFVKWSVVRSLILVFRAVTLIMVLKLKDHCFRKPEHSTEKKESLIAER